MVARRRFAKLALATGCVLAMQLTGRDVRADEGPTGSPYRLKWTYDSALVALGTAGANSEW